MPNEGMLKIQKKIQKKLLSKQRKVTVGSIVVYMVVVNLQGLMQLHGQLDAKNKCAGEILLTSMDQDGTKDGYDLVLTRTMSENLDIPVIASGGVGTPEHIYEAFKLGKADAALAASIFHFKEYPVPVVKEYLKKKGVPVRI